jgi:DNA-binding NarL/FixJ family response regulator
MPRRFLVVDDHPLMRDAIRTILSTLNETDCVDTAASLQEAIERLQSTPEYDLTLLDLRLPDANGLHGLKTLRERFPDCPLVVMSGDPDTQTIAHCMELGASGYIPKTLPGDAITEMLRSAASEAPVRRGRPNKTPSANPPSAPLRAPYHPGTRPSTPAASARRPAPDSPQRLTSRQTDVLRLMLQGLPNKRISQRLDLAEGTVKLHVSRILKVLRVRSRAEAIVAISASGVQWESSAKGAGVAALGRARRTPGASSPGSASSPDARPPAPTGSKDVPPPRNHRQEPD